MPGGFEKINKERFDTTVLRRGKKRAVPDGELSNKSSL